MAFSLYLDLLLCREHIILPTPDTPSLATGAMRAGSALLALLLAAMCWACGNRIREFEEPRVLVRRYLRDDQRLSVSDHNGQETAVGCRSAVILIGVVETWTPLSPDPRRAAVRRNIRETYVK